MTSVFDAISMDLMVLVMALQDGEDLGTAFDDDGIASIREFVFAVPLDRTWGGSCGVSSLRRCEGPVFMSRAIVEVDHNEKLYGMLQVILRSHADDGRLKHEVLSVASYVRRHRIQRAFKARRYSGRRIRAYAKVSNAMSKKLEQQLIQKGYNLPTMSPDVMERFQLD